MGERMLVVDNRRVTYGPIFISLSMYARGIYIVKVSVDGEDVGVQKILKN